jgi:2C-methyl-D-erythritol 2,4-cyclodiphosphate synthase
LLKIQIDQVGLTFTSGEGLTEFGRGQGMQALTIANIAKND